MNAARERILDYSGLLGRTRLHFERFGPVDAGAGAPLVALHSGPGFGAATLRPGIEALAAQRPVILIDLPGCGRSSRHPGSGYPIEAYVECVMRVRDALGATARAHPQAFGGAVLVNPLRVLHAHGQDHEAQARRMHEVDAELASRFAEELGPAIAAALQGQGDWDAIEHSALWPRLLRTQWAATPTAAWQRAIAEAQFGMEAYFAHKGSAMMDPAGNPWSRFDLAARLPLLKLPVSVLASDHDANYVAPPRLHAQPLCAARPGLSFDLLCDVGHFLISEAPDAVAAHLQRHHGRVAGA
jgi:pimeloyl-ACP methyl ester carboxylesterase